ncbi:MAG: MBL fold metallo-hydrolase [Ruminococcaceae bacterium]|nr:MBL fold metallo-hydrolase [Oscillospiraceae bacterium]
MKKRVRIFALLMMLAMLVTSLPMFATAGETSEEDVIGIGTGGAYATIADAISKIGTDNLDGKTLKLLGDVKVGSTKFESTSATAPNIVVDGDGYLITMSSGFVCIGVNITFKNIHAKQASQNHPFIYARKDSHVTVENCYTDDSFKYVFALNNAGNCNLTINSGNYAADQKIFNIDAYKNNSAAMNTVTIKDGYFNANGGNIAAISAYTKLSIEGGTFYTETRAPMIVDTKNLLSGDVNKASVSVKNACFIYPTDGMGMFGENTAVATATNMTADASVKLFAIIEGSTEGKSYKGSGSTTDNVYSFTAFDTVGAVASGATVINGAENTFAKAYMTSGKTFLINSSESLQLLDSAMFDGALVLFHADSNAAADFTKASMTVDKNGYYAPNIKSSTGVTKVRSNLEGADVYWQATGEVAPTGDATCKVRFIVGINGENYKRAGLLYTTDPARANDANLYFDENSEYTDSVKIYKADGYYTSIIASEEVVGAKALGGIGLLVLDAGEYNAQQVKESLYVRAYLTDANGNTTYTDIKTVTVEDAFAGEGELVGTFELDQGHSMDLYKKANMQSFEDKCAALVADGYTLYQENLVGSARYRTYYKAAGTKMCHIYWADHDKELRVITATTDKLPITSTSGNNDLCTAKFITLQGGDELGMVIRLNDGRFIIIDGGNHGQHTQIYSILKEHAVDPNNIRIATWYITHAHGDHHSGYKDFAQTYCTDSTITLESVMFNQLNNGSYIKYGTTNNDVINYTNTYYPTVPVYMPQTGQKYTFSKTTIEILYTMADYLPNTLLPLPDGKADGNTQTMPCIIDIVNDADYDDRLFVMGDMVEYACDDICDRYGSLIACDIVQVSHHGLCVAPYVPLGYRRHNSTNEIYTLINPTIAFWPGKEDEFARRMTGPVNIHLTEIIGGQDKYYKAWVSRHVFEFKPTA